MTNQSFKPELTVMRTLMELIASKDFDHLETLLSENPALANEPFTLGDGNPAKAHPLHRICDGVFTGHLTDEEAVKFATLLLAHGADVNGNITREKQDSPLTAAASLNAEAVALLYIEHGADIHHVGCHGGTPLHWAAWTGQDKTVKRLLEEDLDINKRCIDFKATPLFWAVHGLKSGGKENQRRQPECIRLLVAAGADKQIPNAEGRKPIDLLGDGDEELMRILS